jgi:O-methyltransferase
MKNLTKRLIERVFRTAGYELRKIGRHDDRIPVEFSEKEAAIFRHVLGKNLTMVSPERLVATILSSRYVVEKEIEGDFVECGVWRGGNSLAAKLVFEANGSDRKVHLFDTFAGMTEPTGADVKHSDDVPAREEFEKQQRDDFNEWCYASLEEVRKNFADASVEMDGVRFVKGDVGKTLLDKKNLPEKIAVLRIDTDWYESTKLELETLYPRLSGGGVLIIDDYGHWDGARKAVDEYFRESGFPRPLLQYTDYTGRMGIK